MPEFAVDVDGFSVDVEIETPSVDVETSPSTVVLEVTPGPPGPPGAPGDPGPPGTTTWSDITDAPDIPDSLTDLDTAVTGTQLDADHLKLSGIEAGATKNDPDANLRDRATHTGTQSVDTITGLAAVATSGSYDDLTDIPPATWQKSGDNLRYSGGAVEISPSESVGTDDILIIQTNNGTARISGDASSRLTIDGVPLSLRKGLALGGGITFDSGISLDFNGAKINNIASLNTRGAAASVTVSPDYNASQPLASQGIIVAPKNTDRGGSPRAAYSVQYTNPDSTVDTRFLVSANGYGHVQSVSPGEVTWTVRGAPAQSVDILRVADSSGNTLFAVDSGGPMLVSPNGSRFRLTVDNSGNLTATSV